MAVGSIRCGSLLSVSHSDCGCATAHRGRQRGGPGGWRAARIRERTLWHSCFGRHLLHWQATAPHPRTRALLFPPLPAADGQPPSSSRRRQPPASAACAAGIAAVAAATSGSAGFSGECPVYQLFPRDCSHHPSPRQPSRAHHLGLCSPAPQRPTYSQAPSPRPLPAAMMKGEERKVLESRFSLDLFDNDSETGAAAQVSLGVPKGRTQAPGA